MTGHITIRQERTNKVVRRKPAVVLSDGNVPLSVEFSGSCQEEPEAYAVLAMVCSGMVQFELIHTCTPSVDETFCLDVGRYDVELKQGLTVVDSFKARIIN